MLNLIIVILVNLNLIKKFLLNILKKKNLKKKQRISPTYSKINNKPFTEKIINYSLKTSYNLNKKFHDLPGLSQFQNITDEKINNLINKSNVISNKSLKLSNITNIKVRFNKCNYKNNNFKSNNTPITPNLKTFFNKNKYDNKIIINYTHKNTKNSTLSKKRNNFRKNNFGSKRYKLSLNAINSNFTTSSSYLQNKTPNLLKIFTNKNSLFISKNNSHINDITSNIQKIKLKKINIINRNFERKWVESIRDSLQKKFDFLRRDSKIDRLIFYIENPDECFEENLFDKKPGDKYQLFKNQILKHKTKLENIINELRLNQIKSEYLMKKYIFDLLSRRKKIY